MLYKIVMEKEGVEISELVDLPNLEKAFEVAEKLAEKFHADLKAIDCVFSGVKRKQQCKQRKRKL